MLCNQHNSGKQICQSEIATRTRVRNCKCNLFTIRIRKSNRNTLIQYVKKPTKSAPNFTILPNRTITTGLVRYTNNEQPQSINVHINAAKSTHL